MEKEHELKIQERGNNEPTRNGPSPTLMHFNLYTPSRTTTTYYSTVLFYSLLIACLYDYPLVFLLHLGLSVPGTESIWNMGQ